MWIQPGAAAKQRPGALIRANDMQKLEMQKLGQALGQNALGMQGGQLGQQGWPVQTVENGNVNTVYTTTGSGSGLLARTVAATSNRYNAASIKG